MNIQNKTPWAALMEQRAAEGPMCHLEQVRELISLDSGAAAAIAAALDQGRPVPVRPADSPAAGDGPIASAHVQAAELEQTLAAMEAADGKLRQRQGLSCLCLARGRLANTGLSAPLLLRPVQLTQRRGGWYLEPGGATVLNRAALAQLPGICPVPQEGWSPIWEFLLPQLETALKGDGSWQVSDELWLALLPLWVYALGDVLDLPVPDDSLGRRLSEDAPVSQPPVPQAEDARGEEGIPVSLPLNGVQMSALHALLEGSSLLAQGSRGTGKTQLTAALTAAAMGNRQRVLVLSPSGADRQALLERMGELGLRDLCLHLPTRGDCSGEVLRQYDAAAQLRPVTGAEDYFSLAAAVSELSARLDDAAGLLHTSAPCGLSPFQLICGYLESRQAEGYLPISDSAVSALDAQGFQDALDCAQGMVRSAQALGTPWDHPLSIVQGEDYHPENAQLVPPAAQAVYAAADDAQQALSRWLMRTGLDAPVTGKDWRRHITAARLLAQWRDYPPAWAVSARVPLLGDAVRELKSRTELVHTLRREILNRWGEGVLSMAAIELEQQWRFHKAEWTLPSDPDREAALRRLTTEAEALLNDLEQTGRQWARLVEIDPPGTRDSWERSYEVAAELARWKEIPREWGSCPSLSALLWDVGELIDIGRQAKESKEVLLRDWTEDFLALDGIELAQRWEREGGSWGLGWFTRQGTIRNQLEPFCKGKMTTDVLENGLRWLADYQQELRDCDEIYHRWERELGSVYRREETVWVWLETARRVAAESHDWLSELTGSEDFLRKYGDSEEALAAAELLQEQWERSREVLGRLDVMIGRTSQPDGKDWLSGRRNDCRRLRNLIKIRKQLEERSSTPVAMSEIADTLHALSRFQQEESALEALRDRWEAELGDAYQGMDTDWDTLSLRSLQAVESDDRIAQLTGDLTLRAKLAGDPDALEEAQALIQAFSALGEAWKRLEELSSVRLDPERGDWLMQIRSHTRTLLAHLDKLDLWIQWHGLCRQAQSLGLHSFAAHYDQSVPEGEDTAMLFRKSLYRAVLLRTLEQDQQLRQFSSRGFLETLERYARLEAQYTRRTREELFHVAVAPIPALLRREDLAQETALLQAANRPGAAPADPAAFVRRLPGLTAQLFPCVIAAPMDALACFAGGNTPPFDYIVLHRPEGLPWPVGRQLLGLGRTALLLSHRGQRLDFPTLSEEQSLWQQCLERRLPLLCLNCCFLPRQESLSRPDQGAFGVSIIPTARPSGFRILTKTVVGRMQDNANPAEASAVAEQARILYQSGEDRLAVVAMTWEQRRLIRRLLDQTVTEDGGSLSSIPVMAAEDVSAGGWDRVLLSLTLGPDRNERMNAARRVLDQWDGFQPISLALSVARREVWVFSCVDRQDWPALEIASPELVDFLRYADQDRAHEPEHPFRDQIQRELTQSLQQAGYDAAPGPVPVSVQISLPSCPGTPMLGILLDDEAYGAIARTRERELTAVQLLSHRGWALIRVFSLDWWRNREQALEQIIQHIQRIQAAGEAAHPTSGRPAASGDEIPFYTQARLTVMGIRDTEVTDPAFRNRVYRVVEDILRQEAPLSSSQLAQRMLCAFGVDPRDEELRKRCSLLWPRLGLRMTHEETGEYVWTGEQDPDHYRIFRRCGTGSRFRRPEDVCCQEGAAAACHALARRKALPPDALARETARLLGFDPWNEAAFDCGRRGVEYALFMGRAEETAVGSIVLRSKSKEAFL